ncbi:class E sortase [Corynebacterium caspium]|uniref:class E sortase n=1 Tax=Corynebacterium caspium TaxID=234828 RepID=UPI00036B0B4F|nr:class E sortase [Corynebacterium caspium]WKD60013.1 Sortase family protein [Corynebacterium caspium DSM 44850]
MAQGRLSHALGELLLTVGILISLFAFYESYWTNIVSHKLQQQVNENLEESWSNQRNIKIPELGDAFARLYVPRFGTDFHYAILEGAEEAQLIAGPGRYPATQQPGEKGNFAIAGHRVGKGAPFNDLGALKTCDALVVETPATWEIYRVLPISGSESTDCFGEKQAAVQNRYSHVAGRHITVPTDISVIAPVPGEDTAAPAAPEALITLTTCHPQFSNAERMIVHGMLVESLPKQAGNPPAVLKEN